MVHALSDTNLIRKLLTMKIEETTDMLAVCQMHIAIVYTMSSMSLATKTTSTVQKSVKKQTSHSSPCGNCTTPHSRKRAKDPTCHTCQNVGHWKQKCRKSNKAKDSNKKSKSQIHRPPGGRKRADEVGVSDGDPAFDEITIHT